MSLLERAALYLYDFRAVDERVSNWPLMWSIYPTLLMSGIYLLIVWLGPKLMRNRPAFELRKPIFVYNVCIMLLNLYICSEILIGAWKAKYSLACQPVNYTMDPNEMRIANAFWWFYFSKVIEFADTFFFILRKKDRQLSFLHVYHHSTVFPLCWVGLTYVVGGQTFVGPLINSFIHVLMYTYYGVSSLGPKYQKYVWWKIYLTQLQQVQFILGMLHLAVAMVTVCNYPRFFTCGLFVYEAYMFYLFRTFYTSNYNKKPATTASKANGSLANGSALAKSASLETSTQLSNGFLKKQDGFVRNRNYARA